MNKLERLEITPITSYHKSKKQRAQKTAKQEKKKDCSTKNILAHTKRKIKTLTKQTRVNSSRTSSQAPIHQTPL